jgi:SAM-dependent methyltransferase
MSATNETQPCRVCGSREVSGWLNAREMMHGTRDRFVYFSCAACGCLQLSEVPANLGKYYPANYYSLQQSSDVPINWKTAIKLKLVRPFMTRYKLGWGSAFGRLLCNFKQGPNFPEWLRFLPRPIPFDSVILDVGCGAGMALLMLRDCGFTNLRGIDPFIEKSITYSGGVRIDKQQLPEVRGKFDLITFNHVYEHLEDPAVTLQQARQLLAEGGQILIRIPLADSVAAQKYRENWVQLDAPRHITLQTRKSMEILAKKSGLKIIKVVYDSTEFQFLASEQYIQDIPLMEKPTHSLFTKEIIEKYMSEARRLNALEQGDQAAFLLMA